MKILNLYTCFFVFLFQILNAHDWKPDVTIKIPMRDGVELPTDLYLPSPEARNLPCILLRSPAGRQSHWTSFAELAKAGYVVAIQDTRSALDAEGKTIPFISDGWGKLQDGYDTVEWLAQSSYTNGKIGTWGTSALGITQLLMAPSKPPHLKSQYIVFAAASLYHHGMFSGGLLLKNQVEGWLGLYARDTGILNLLCQRPFYDDFWKQLNSLDRTDHVTVPALHIGGWYDIFIQGTLAAFTARQYQGGEGARGRQKLIIGPWTHFWPKSQKLGDFDIPSAGLNPPFDISPKSWFDCHLKDIKNEIENLPPVTYYVMGPFDGTPSCGNVWRTSNNWPVPATPTTFYMTSQCQLKAELSPTNHLSYHYDPQDPIPTIGGHNLFLESGPKDQSCIEGRKDLLVFTTDTLTQDLEVTGFLSAILFFSSDQEDTDVILRLCDVYPDGRSILISEGSYRLGVMYYSNGESSTLKRQEPLKIQMDLGVTSMVFAKGHAIRLSVSSSNYPRYEKNMNVGLLGANQGKYQIAKNTLYMGEKYPSCLILPIVKHKQ